jgi:hypothetical protein
MLDGGSARADFTGGHTRTLYCSIQRVLRLPREQQNLSGRFGWQAGRGLILNNDITDANLRLEVLDVFHTAVMPCRTPGDIDQRP